MREREKRVREREKREKSEAGEKDGRYSRTSNTSPELKCFVLEVGVKGKYSQRNSGSFGCSGQRCFQPSSQQTGQSAQLTMYVHVH